MDGCWIREDWVRNLARVPTGSDVTESCKVVPQTRVTKTRWTLSVLNHYEAILERVYAGNAILFLGAGSTLDCRKADNTPGLSGYELAGEILKEMTGNRPLNIPEKSMPNLMEAAEYFQAVHSGKRTALDRFVQKRLQGLRPTLGHYLATTFPWKAIVTTNYNSVAEDAWAEARNHDFAANEIVVIRIDADLGVHSRENSKTRFYKPHGCVNHQGFPEHRMVLTSEDYFVSKSIRKDMYARISELAQENSTVFVGYSLSDYTFRNLYFALYMDMGKWAHRCFSVAPISPPDLFDWKSEAMDALNTKLINTTFDAFMLRLVLKRGTLHPELKRRLASQWNDMMKCNPQPLEGLEKSMFDALT